MVPEPYLSALGTLVDSVPVVPFEMIEREIVVAYGKQPEEMFESFDREPLASGSLGQVYRARYEGRDVVVKVLRPGVERLVTSDIHAVSRLLDIISARWSNSHLRGFRVVVDEFSKRIGEEMDFRQEATNAIAIADRFATNPRSLLNRRARRHLVYASFANSSRRRCHISWHGRPGFGAASANQGQRLSRCCLRLSR